MHCSFAAKGWAVTETIFPRIYARMYYAHPRARVMSFSDCTERMTKATKTTTVVTDHNLPPQLPDRSSKRRFSIHCKQRRADEASAHQSCHNKRGDNGQQHCCGETVLKQSLSFIWGQA
jgi:hypothetical protein